MDRYIGLDAHASSCALAVLSPSAKRLGSQVVDAGIASRMTATEAGRSRPMKLAVKVAAPSITALPSRAVRKYTHSSSPP